LFLSKTTLKVKNLAAAMQFCKSAGVGLEIAGGRRPVGLRLKALTTRGFSWLGPVNGKEKAKALARARALVFPVVWDEPFGLVVAEALMSGTPVLASPRGSLPELVPPEVGRLISVNDPEQWKEVLTGGYKDFSASVCREWAIQKFHYMKMAQEYLALYQRLIREKSLNRRP
jgi:glycosyltransferase involved in cell wall biosynthesis